MLKDMGQVEECGISPGRGQNKYLGELQEVMFASRDFKEGWKIPGASLSYGTHLFKSKANEGYI